MSEATTVQSSAPRANRAKTWTLIVGTVIVLIIGVVAAAQLFARPAADGMSESGTIAKKRDPVFVSLEQFTVNLADEGGERLAQIGITLEVADEKTDRSLRAHMPSIRNAVLLLLSSKKSEELLTLAGKNALAAQIAASTGAELGWSETNGSGENPISAVNFSHFIVQ